MKSVYSVFVALKDILYPLATPENILDGTKARLYWTSIAEINFSWVANYILYWQRNRKYVILLKRVVMCIGTIQKFSWRWINSNGLCLPERHCFWLRSSPPPYLHKKADCPYRDTLLQISTEHTIRIGQFPRTPPASCFLEIPAGSCVLTEANGKCSPHLKAASSVPSPKAMHARCMQVRMPNLGTSPAMN